MTALWQFSEGEACWCELMDVYLLL